ncbi:thermonuclease family protein [Pseudobacteriovorax antillogorgiicola]|uniref:Nuclease homologue n=1 Tax=Pseudobacteriovorax antillogorgiicola TaxID=1513793 RepID=A0A1Y6B6I0_9BACT|nr:thermonuclease family protein [Pseudobacteriovorax antillogorgiicola]TCS58796.1 nuclease-like protein [Pseudobacteriovorax antillogorgiicola]SME94593.1 nuclease homologue [Pseudobacteriovorax antillogorgiicola]
MRILFIYASIVLSSLQGVANASVPRSQACQHQANEFRCVRYLSNYDGDTITFQIDGVHPLLGDKIPIRLSGVDTPELKSKQRCEKELARWAKRFVRAQMRQASTIKLSEVKRGKYFRVVAKVDFDGKDLGDLLLKNGLAVPYDGGKKSKVNWCKKLAMRSSSSARR